MSILIGALIFAAVVIVIIFFLFKYRIIGAAEFELGVPGFTTKLKMQSEQRQMNKEKSASVNPQEMYVDSNIGFIIHKPFSNEWKFIHSTMTHLWEDKGYKKDTMEPLGITNETCDVLISRRGEGHTIKYTGQTMINGEEIILEDIEHLIEEVKEIVYDQVIVLSFKKNPEDKMGLLDFFLMHARWAMLVGPRKLFVNPDNSVFLLDCSAKFENIECDGKIGDHILNNVTLCLENDKYFFAVVTNYIQVADKPTTVWDDLRKYLESFRVLID